MTPETQRIAIAEACGWTRFTWSEPDGQCEGWQPPKGAAVYSDDIDVLPDYLCDLNAMHEAEKVLTDAQSREYSGRLLILLGFNREIPFFTEGGSATIEFEQMCGALRSATAAQRAEVFCRTMPSKQNLALSIWEWHERTTSMSATH